MTTKERRDRQFAEREQRFLAKARELIERDGLLNLQMLKVAEACDYSVGTLYHHFNSKEDMLLAMLTTQVGDRLKFFQRVSDWNAGTRDRLLGFIFADLLLAIREPLFCQLHQYLSIPIISTTITPARRALAIEAHQPLTDLFLQVIDEAISNGDLTTQLATPLQIGLGLWALIEGAHALEHTEGIQEAYRIASPYSQLLHHVNALLSGYQWQPLTPLDDLAAREELLNRLTGEVFTEFSEIDLQPLRPRVQQGSL